ncbi:hypothetical protein UFOVP598_35 [uncultured Caudovirales phage]|uniref:Uncharacterized protein n=1 Tax=uncultured Caudovirales phage TaxID=2100421 RepID=A0A6J5MYU5_9CAUD|nr:hypothetical protein UFOVP598_35 [uncultured Caudovirales phage]
MERTINYKDVELRCEFSIDKYEPATYWQPDEGGDIYDLFVYVQETEMMDILGQKQIDDIKDLIYEQL